jgi:hypothetical protein
VLVGGLVFGVIFGLIFRLIYEPFPVELSVLGGLVFGLVGGLAFGGYACLSHAALRFVLWRAGALPLCTITFLDYATERVVLRRHGGGYVFLHRLLQEYFASLEAPTELRIQR